MNWILVWLVFLFLLYVTIHFQKEDDYEVGSWKYKQKIENGVIENYICVQDKNNKFGEVMYLLHSIKDKPAVIYPSGTKEWHFYGNLHRNNGPAVVHANGDEEWWIHSKRHRSDGPAMTIGDKKIWYFNGEIQYE